MFVRTSAKFIPVMLAPLVTVRGLSGWAVQAASEGLLGERHRPGRGSAGPGNRAAGLLQGRAAFRFHVRQARSPIHHPEAAGRQMMMCPCTRRHLDDETSLGHGSRLDTRGWFARWEGVWCESRPIGVR